MLGVFGTQQQHSVSHQRLKKKKIHSDENLWLDLTPTMKNTNNFFCKNI